MKIGIITVHDSANFGSILQAYALQNFLINAGHEVWFVKTRTREEVKKIYLGGKRNFIKYIKNYKYNIQKYNCMLPIIDQFPEIDLSEVSTENIDLLIIGSDELWNINTPFFRNEYFYGININTKYKMTYAISCGNAKSEELRKYPVLVKGIKEIDTILVRDDLTQYNIEQLLGVKPEKVCDPTLLVDKKLFLKDYVVPINEKYILIYAYSVHETIEGYIKRYAKENNLKLVAVCMPKAWCDYNIMCDPFQFSSLIKKAECVVTATFHGSIFSILNESKFIVCSELPKVKNILKQLGAEEQLFKGEGYGTFVDCLERNLNYKEINKKMEEQKEISKGIFLNYLEKYIRQVDSGEKD